MTKLDIERLAYGTDAIAHLPDGRTAFVSGACPGDSVEVEIVEERDRFVRARVVDVLCASSQRVSPACPHADQCGGCPWMHISYDTQLSAKRSAVVDALARIGKIEGAEDLVGDIIPSPLQLGYRNKVEFVASTATGRLVLGYHRAGSDEIVPVDECLLLPKKYRKAPKSLGGALRYLSGGSDLGLARVGLRVGTHTRDVEIALWTPPGAFPRNPAAKTLGTAIPSTSLVRVLFKGPIKERRASKVEVLSGKGYWRERVAGHDFSVSAPSFFQVNTKAAELLVIKAIELLEPDGSDRVLDLFSGVGTFTLPLAELAGDTVAVESAGSSVRDLRRNLENAALWAEVVGGDAGRELPSLGRFDLVLVDPPRSGLGAATTAALAATKARTLVYVSCDPATLARDAQMLAERGYRLTSATPVDLFPQTFHVETVARFERV